LFQGGFTKDKNKKARLVSKTGFVNFRYKKTCSSAGSSYKYISMMKLHQKPLEVNTIA